MTYTYNESGVTYNQTGVTYDGDTALGLSNLPVVGVFVAFDDGPYVADPDWVEVTDYVRDVSIRRGRQDDLQQFPSGSCSIVFDNRDRLFDPFNTAGAYYGKLKPRRQVRVVGQWNGVNYPLFRGFVAGWPVEFTEGGKDSTVTVDCFDLVGLLATEKLPVDWVNDYALSLSPAHYWRCNEAQPVSQVADSTGSWVITPTTINADRECYETPSFASGIKATGLFFQSWSYRNLVGVPDASESVSFVGYVKLSAADNIFYSSLVNYQRGRTGVTIRTNGVRWELRVYTNGTSSGYYRQYFIIPTTGSVDSSFHLAVTVLRQASAYPTVNIYVNGLPQTIIPVDTSTTLGPVQENFSVTNAAIQEFMIFDRVLTQTEVENIYNYSEGRILEDTVSRANRVLAQTAISPTLETSEGSAAGVVSQIGLTQSILGEIQKASESEGGAVFCDAAGVVRFVTRDYWASRSRSNTSQVSFSDVGTAIFYDAGAIRVNLDADLVRNDVNVVFTSNGQISSQDSTSIADYGSANMTVDTYLSSPVEAQELGDRTVSVFKNPKLRVEPFLVKGQRNPSYDWPRLLNLELLDRFTFVRTPSVGSAIQKDMLLQSIAHRITPGTWETTINGSARYTGWFILGVSLLGSTEDVLL